MYKYEASISLSFLKVPIEYLALSSFLTFSENGSDTETDNLDTVKSATRLSMETNLQTLPQIQTQAYRDETVGGRESPSLLGVQTMDFEHKTLLDSAPRQRHIHFIFNVIY